MKRNKDKYILFFACCIPVKGYCRASIIDIQRQNIYFVPNEVILLINEFHGRMLSDILDSLDTEDAEIFMEYIEFLFQNEIIFAVDSKNDLALFPALTIKWDFPGFISNAIVEINQLPDFPAKNIIAQLESLGCKALCFYIYSKVSYDELLNFLGVFKNSNIQFIELFINNNNFSEYEIDKLLKHNLRISSINIYGVCEELAVSAENHQVFFHKKALISFDCGTINISNFSMNIDFCMEARSYNSCLNRKICIDVNGDIKNCPSMQESFGNIKNVTLQDVLNNRDFKSLWGITKDHIDVCQDCEFRYVCTDCRAYTDKPNIVLARPAKCTYNPYIALWQGQEGYCTVSEWRNANNKPC